MARRTCFREQYYTGTMNYYWARKIGASNHVKLYILLGWFFIDNFGLTNSFGLGSFVQRDMIILHQLKLVQGPGKSMGERFGGVNVILHVINIKNFSIWRRLRHQKWAPGSKIACWRTVLKDSHGSKNLLQRAILYRHKEVLLRREDWSFKPSETMCRIWSVFLW